MDFQNIPRAALEREVRYLRRCVRRLEGLTPMNLAVVRVPKKNSSLSTLEERLAAHIEAAREFDERYQMSVEIFGEDEQLDHVEDSPRSP